MSQPTEEQKPQELPWMKYTFEALSHWGLEGAAVKPLSLSENATYLVEIAPEYKPTTSANAFTPAAGTAPAAPATSAHAEDAACTFVPEPKPCAPTPEKPKRYILRLNRPGYREEALIRSELAWICDIAERGEIQVARPIPTKENDLLCRFANPEGKTQYAVLFDFLEGKEPAEGGLASSMERIGRIAAKMHASARAWQRPSWFKRIVWDENRIVGDASDFGDWRNTPEVTPELQKLLERTEAKMLREMENYGKTPENFGLIHTDLRSSNLLIDSEGKVKVIDFDDCGEGWFLFDIACTFSFEESSDNIEDMVLSYLKGYYEAGGIVPVRDLSYLPAMLIARRLMLIAWVEKRKETIWASLIRDRYVAETRQIALDYLQDNYLPRILKMARGAKEQSAKAHDARTLSNVA